LRAGSSVSAGQSEFYSNYGYGLLGALIEAVTGRRFERYMDEEVLRPLQMDHSTFAQPLPSEAASTPLQLWRWFQLAAI